MVVDAAPSGEARNGPPGMNFAVNPADTRIVAPHTRAALSAIVSSTGWMSVGELAITPRISLVAVCCSNDFA